MSANALVASFHESRRISPVGIAVVVVAHAALLAGLMALKIVPVPEAASTLMVQVIHETPPKPPEVIPPKPIPPAPPVPKPRPQQRIAPPTQVLASQTPLPSAAPEVQQLEDPKPLPPVDVPPPPPVISAPQFDADYLDNPKPAYPPLARRMGEEGKVVLRVFVESNGRPSRLEIKSSSGSERLDQAARDAVGRWKFVPARQGETAVSAWVLVPITFSLKD